MVLLPFWVILGHFSDFQFFKIFDFSRFKAKVCHPPVTLLILIYYQCKLAKSQDETVPFRIKMTDAIQSHASHGLTTNTQGCSTLQIIWARMAALLVSQSKMTWCLRVPVNMNVTGTLWETMLQHAAWVIRRNLCSHLVTQHIAVPNLCEGLKWCVMFMLGWALLFMTTVLFENFISY